MLIAIWLKALIPTDQEYVDKRGRRRKHHKLRKFPLLVAYGWTWSAGSAECSITAI